MDLNSTWNVLTLKKKQYPMLSQNNELSNKTLNNLYIKIMQNEKVN